MIVHRTRARRRIRAFRMADVVGGAMRQENADADFRKTTILTTIDNFRAFAEVVLENLAEKAIEKGVNAEDHPELVVDILHASKKAEKNDDEETDEEKKAREEAEAKAKEEADAAAAAAGEEEETGALDFNAVVTSFNEALNNFGETLVATLGKQAEAAEESSAKTLAALEGVTSKLEEIQNTPIASKSEKEEQEDEPDDNGRNISPKSAVFKGTFFRGMSDFR